MGVSSRFASTQSSEGAALGLAVDLANAAAGAADTPKTVASFIATVAEMIGAIMRLSGQAAINITTPSAAALVAAIPNAQAGMGCDFVVMNGNSGTATLVAGSGVTLVGVTAVPTTKTQIYKISITNATKGSEAVSVIGLLQTPS